jgi:2-keto-3-deoxy-L-rhamnonate aldolase RhmA
MRRSNASLVERLRANELLIGTLLSARCPELAEAFSLVGFDWFFIDLEHSTLDVAAAQQTMQAIADRAYSVIRIPGLAEEHFKKALDAGCDGVVVPMIKSKEMAEAAVQFAKYPPLGSRGAGIGRAQGFGLNFAEYVATANARVALILQIEHIDAVNRIGEILAVPGFDAIFIGPYDLSGSMNRLGEVSAPEVLEAIARVRAACLSARVPFGSFTMSVEQAQSEIDAGARLMAIGTDVSFMLARAKEVIDAFPRSSQGSSE